MENGLCTKTENGYNMEEKKKNQKLIILKGVPASGKSTFAREYVKGRKDIIIVNRDSIRVMCGDYWLPEREDYITSAENFMVEKGLEKGYTVMVDATNLNPKTMRKWRAVAEIHGVELETKEFKISVEEALKRDNERERKVGEKVILEFFEKYYFDEFFQWCNGEKGV